MQSTIQKTRDNQSSVLKLFVLYVVCSVLLFLCATALFIAPTIDSSFDRLASEEENHIVKVEAGQINQYLLNKKRVLQDIAKSPLIAQTLLLGETPSPALKDYLSTALLLGENPELTLIDINGKILFTEEKNPTYFKWVTPLFERLEHQHILTIKEGNSPFFCLAVPFKYGSGIEGALVAKFSGDLNKIFPTALKHHSISLSINDKKITSRNKEVGFSRKRQTTLSDFRINLLYSFDVEGVEGEKKSLIQNLAISGVVASIISFIIIFFLGRNVFVKPFQKLISSQTAISEAIEGISFVGHNENFISVNQSFSSTICIEEKDLLGKPWTSILIEEDREKAKEAYKTMIKDGSAIFEARSVCNARNAGDPTFMNMTLVADYDTSKKFNGHYCFLQNITENKKHEDLLIQTHLTTTDANLTPNDKMEIILKAGLKYFGLDLAIIGKISDEFYHIISVFPQKKLKNNQSFRLAQTYCEQTFSKKDVCSWHNAGESSLAEEACYKRLGINAYIGTTIYVKNKPYGTINFSRIEPRERPFSKIEKNFINLLAQWAGNEIARQIDSEVKEELITKLSDSNKELEHFAYIASHDLQEPLRMVRNFTTLLQEEYADQIDENGQKYIEVSRSSAKRMENLVTGLLDHARIGEEDEEIEEVSSQIAIDNAIKNLEHAIKKSGAEITYDKKLPIINGHPMHMTRLFENLISNALKYQDGSRTPAIHIGFQDHIDKWVFEVKDNGIGIKEEYCDQIFRPFKRLHSYGQYEGTGIGLTICQKIMRLHGGDIHAKSELDVGTSFFITLPKTDLTFSERKLSA